MIREIAIGGVLGVENQHHGTRVDVLGTPSPENEIVAKAVKQERGGKSEAVRQYLKAHRKAPVREVVDALGLQGIEVSIALVNSIKYRKKKPGRKKGKRASKGGASVASLTAELCGDSISLASLLEAKKAADRVGGLSVLLRAVEALAKLSQ